MRTNILLDGKKNIVIKSINVVKYLGSNIIGSSTGCMQQTILLQVNKRILKNNQLIGKYSNCQVRVESMESTLK